MASIAATLQRRRCLTGQDPENPDRGHAPTGENPGVQTCMNQASGSCWSGPNNTLPWTGEQRWCGAQGASLRSGGVLPPPLSVSVKPRGARLHGARDGPLSCGRRQAASRLKGADIARWRSRRLGAPPRARPDAPPAHRLRAGCCSSRAAFGRSERGLFKAKGRYDLAVLYHMQDDAMAIQARHPDEWSTLGFKTSPSRSSLFHRTVAR